MADQIKLYISAAGDLERERDLLGRVVTELPVPLAWSIHQSPLSNAMLDLEAIMAAEIHILLLGGDIRAPIGLEWQLSWRSGNRPILMAKQGIHRTPAAQNFLRFVGNPAAWVTFHDDAELRYKVLSYLITHILDNASLYKLSEAEEEVIRDFRSDLTIDWVDSGGALWGGAGESGEIYSTQRFMPGGGILLETGGEEGTDSDR